MTKCLNILICRTNRTLKDEVFWGLSSGSCRRWVVLRNDQILSDKRNEPKSLKMNVSFLMALSVWMRRGFAFENLENMKTFENATHLLKLAPRTCKNTKTQVSLEWVFKGILRKPVTLFYRQAVYLVEQVKHICTQKWFYFFIWRRADERVRSSTAWAVGCSDRRAFIKTQWTKADYREWDQV